MGIRCPGLCLSGERRERPKHPFDVDQRGIAAWSIVAVIEVAATHQNLIRSPQLGSQNGGLAGGAEGFAKLSFNFSPVSSVPVHVGSSGDQSVPRPVLRSVIFRRCVQSNATQSVICAAITSYCLIGLSHLLEAVPGESHRFNARVLNGCSYTTSSHRRCFNLRICSR